MIGTFFSKYSEKFLVTNFGAAKKRGSPLRDMLRALLLSLSRERTKVVFREGRRERGVFSKETHHVQRDPLPESKHDRMSRTCRLVVRSYNSQVVAVFQKATLGHLYVVVEVIDAYRSRHWCRCVSVRYSFGKGSQLNQVEEYGHWKESGR